MFSNIHSMIVEGSPAIPMGFEKGNLVVERVRVIKYNGIQPSEEVLRKPQNVLSLQIWNLFLFLHPQTLSISPLKMGSDLVKLCVFLMMILDIIRPEGYITLHSLFMNEYFLKRDVLVKPW